MNFLRQGLIKETEKIQQANTYVPPKPLLQPQLLKPQRKTLFQQAYKNCEIDAMNVVPKRKTYFKWQGKKTMQDAIIKTCYSNWSIWH